MADDLHTESPHAASYLEHFPESGEVAHRLLLDHFPFYVGRSMSAHYCINSRHVSKEHALIYRIADQVRIRDLGSTNGTFVNGRRIQESDLHPGDIVHIAHKEFRFGRDGDAARVGEAATTDRASGALPASVIQSSDYLKELIRRQCVRTLFQPIVDLRTHAATGYEALGRGTHDKLNPSPAYLLSVADQSNLAPELSRLLRRVAAREAASLPPDALLFMNLHPSELRDAMFFRSLEGLPEALGGQRRVVLELHEEAVADVFAMRRLRSQVTALGFGLAYDDFGAGKARLTELADVPPDFIKLDKTLTHDLHLAPGRQELVRALARVGADLGICLVAEGVEVIEEAEVCLSLGCQFGQGFFFGRPQPFLP